MDDRYSILFEPIQIGPKIAKNRFYQVPHCNGMGHALPRSVAAMRGIKAEGGWAVVCTEETEIHASGEIAPHLEGRLWDDSDIPAMAQTADAVHAHGALAGIELVYNGYAAPNRFSRIPPLAPSSISVTNRDPVQARAMDKSDIKAVRKWHRAAALRAKKAGFDIIYVYAGHNLALPMHFISKRLNRRTDEYGGTLENRTRLFRELIEETKEVVGDHCAVAVRFAVDELIGPQGITHENEGREVIEMLAELPDLWDVNISDWSNDSATSRFEDEGYQEKYTAFVKSMTTKPVVGVGRFTSPDTMVSQIRRGVLDFIGAARPSIADPFLPKKIEEGRINEIRECIGCNICVAGDMMVAPIRCTQNPTMGEEWRRGWHPERIEPKQSDDKILVVGSGPAGLECTLALANRGYQVTLAEAADELGGRVSRESRLPGLSAWARVRDYRVSLIRQMDNVAIYEQSNLTVENVREFNFPHVFVAAGSTWRRDGVGRQHHDPIPGLEKMQVLTPDDIMDGVKPNGHVVVYDDDHYYLGGVLAEKLKRDGHPVTLVTPAPDVSTWTHNTLEQERIQTRLLNMGVNIIPQTRLGSVESDRVELVCVFTSKSRWHACNSLLLVTERIPNDALYQALQADTNALAAAGIKTMRTIGDCYAPGIIAAAVHCGHLAAREFQAVISDIPFKRERVQLATE